MEIPNDKELIKNKNKTDADDEEKQTAENKIRQRQPRNHIANDVRSTECTECGKSLLMDIICSDIVRHIFNSV